MRRLGPSLLLALAGCGAALDQPDRELTGFAAPYAAIHDAEQDVYFVSCLDGGFEARDGRGAIARVTPDGAVQHDFVRSGVGGAELHAPKGLAVQGDRLLVCDLDVVRCFDRRSGAPRGVIAVPGAVSLCGAASAPGGEVWLTDCSAQGSAVFAIAADGAVRTLARHPDLHGPSGIVVLPTGAYVVTRGSGEFLQVDGKGRWTALVQTPSRSLDGLVRLAAGQWLCAGEGEGALFTLDLKGGSEPIRWPELTAPGALGLDAARNRLLVPMGTSGKVLLRRI